MGYPSPERPLEGGVPEETTPSLTSALRKYAKKHTLTTALTVALGAASLDTTPANADENVVVNVGSHEEYEATCNFALIEALSTIPNIEVKETWLSLVQKDKLPVRFFKSTDESNGQLARFSVFQKDGKFFPQLEIVGPFMIGASKEKKWSVLLHEFTHYKQWVRGFAKDEYFLLGRNIGAETWKEEARVHFEGEIEAVKAEYEFLDGVHYDGMEAEGRKDTRYRSWKAEGPKHVVLWVHDQLAKQTINDQRMLDYLDELSKIYLKKELQK